MPAGSTCRTRGGKVAPKYHTPASCSSPSSAPNREQGGAVPGRVSVPRPDTAT
ncbi:hypothetical protein ACTWQF_04815 [Streptomyces sp. 8N114]|uniref:hypothetical protein n=1 Tax=Streptomyces sp. 8N114 TaxID=3457419 RepID=UPI003FD2D63A